MSWGAVAGAVGSIAIGALSSSGDSSSAAVAEETRTSSIDQILSDLESSTDAAKQTSEATDTSESSTVNRGTDESAQVLSDLMDSGDGEGQIQALMNQILSDGKSTISNVGTRTGSFGSTTEQLLNNDLVASAATAGVNQQNILDQLKLGAASASQSGTETSTGTGSTVGTGTESNQSTSSQNQTQTTVSDTFANPEDSEPTDGALADLINGGQHLNTDVVPVEPKEPVLAGDTDEDMAAFELAMEQYEENMANYAKDVALFEAQGTQAGLIDTPRANEVAALRLEEELQAKLDALNNANSGSSSTDGGGDNNRQTIGSGGPGGSAIGDAIGDMFGSSGNSFSDKPDGAGSDYDNDYDSSESAFA